MLNHIELQGRLVRDPELRYTQAQTAVASFTIAVEDDYQDNGGERKTQFVDCVAWRSTAEFLSKYFSKGSMAIVTGRLSFRDWEDKNGNKRKSTEIITDRIYFCESKRRGEEAPATGNQSTVTFEEIGSGDGELPF